MNRHKHIVLYTDDPDEGGVAVYNHAILCGLAAAGYRVTGVQSARENPMISRQRELGVAHHWLEFHTRQDFTRTVNNEADAETVFATLRPSVVLFTNCSPYSHNAAKNVAIRHQIPFIIVEGYVTPLQQMTPEVAWFLFFLKKHYEHARAVIAVSEDNLKLLRGNYGLPPRKGEVVHYGRPQEFFREADLEVRRRTRRSVDVPDDAIVCLTVGRLEPVKGYLLQIEAFKQLTRMKAWSRLYFVWIGPGSQEKQLISAVAEMGISDHVKILGQRWDIPDWLDASDVFLLPTFYEGMPLAIMEAMAKGLAVMASSVSGIPEELGDTGKLLASPGSDPGATVRDIINTLETWVENAVLRRHIAEAGRIRADRMFREERMVHETIQVIERALIPAGDYVSPGMDIVLPDAHFPHLTAADPNQCNWKYLRRSIPHNWYADKRAPHTGFLNRDESHILYNTALRFRGKRALEIGCWLGWSACHMALAGVQLDVIDPVLGRQDFLDSISGSLRAAGVLPSVNLVPGFSPREVQELARRLNLKWPLFFIDGNHDDYFPVFDTAVCVEYAEEDALILFHDLASPDVASGLEYLRQRGWNTMVYMTAQIMGVGWRGKVEPVRHVPDMSINWQIPDHLKNFQIFGLRENK